MNTSGNTQSAPHQPASHAPLSRTALSAGRDAVEHVSTAECWRLIEAESFGRLAVAGLNGIPDVFPLNYTVHEGSIYIRTAVGSKLMDIAAHPVAAFEIDGEYDRLRWSVVLRGSARRLAIDKEIRESGVQSLVSSVPTAKYNYICLTPSSVSGRRFVDQSGDSSREHDPSRQPPRPVPIPHFPPL